MPQKPLKAKIGKKKAPVANRHGKGSKTKKGKFDFGVKKPALKKKEAENAEITKAINAENEERTAGIAASAGGKLSVLKPPVTATAEEMQKSKFKPSRPGLAWGASSK